MGKNIAFITTVVFEVSMCQVPAVRLPDTCSTRMVANLEGTVGLIKCVSIEAKQVEPHHLDSRCSPCGENQPTLADKTGGIHWCVPEDQ